MLYSSDANYYSELLFLSFKVLNKVIILNVRHNWMFTSLENGPYEFAFVIYIFILLWIIQLAMWQLVYIAFQ